MDTERETAPPTDEEQVKTESRDAPLVQGSLWKAIWLMSWPLLLTTMAGSLIGIADVQVSGYLGSVYQASVGLAEQILFLFMIFLMSIAVGTTAIVARAFGEGDLQEANFMTGQSLLLSILCGIVLTLGAAFGANFLLPLFSGTKEIVEQGAIYLSIYGLYLLPFSFICISNAAFRAIGDARTPLLVVSTEVVINIAGDYLTVLGNWPVPGLGLKGIAYSAIVSAFVGAAIAWYKLKHSPLKDSLNHVFIWDKKSQKRLLDLGVPSALQRLSWAASVFVVFFILAKLKEPTAALASWTIGMRVEALLFMPLMALSLAVSSIVGQNLGASEEGRARKAGWHMTWIGVVLMIILGGVLFVCAQPLAAIMSRDPETIRHTTSYLQINALAEPFLAINMILAGALQGAGDTRIPMWVSIFSNWIVRLPLATVLALNLGMGPSGVWIAMSVSVTVAAALLAWRFQSGNWVKIKV